MPPRPRLQLAAVLAVSALGLSACGGDGETTEVLEQNIEAQDAALQALQGRVTELASEVRSTPSTDPGPQVEDVATRLDELVTRLEEVESTVAEQADEDVTATVAAEIGKFSEEIEGLVASVRDLTTVVDRARDDLDRLEATFQEHADDPFAHNRGDTATD